MDAGCGDRGDFADSFKGTARRADYRKRPHELPGHGRTRKRSRASSPRLGPAARKSRARGADRLRLGSSRGSGGPVCLLAHWESGLMATRKPSPRNRAVRPAAEDLESRHLLSKVVSGTDIDGDTWTLQLFGRGSLTVVKQNDPTTGSPAALNSATEINQIIVGGTDPLHSRLVGPCHQGAERQRTGLLPEPHRAYVQVGYPRGRQRPAGDQHAQLLPGQHHAHDRHDHDRPRPRSSSPTASTRSASAASIPRTTRSPRPPAARRATSTRSRSACPCSAAPGSSSTSRSAAPSRSPPPARQRRRPSSTL